MWDDSNIFDDSGAGFLQFEGENAGPSKPPSESKARNLVAVSIDQLMKLATMEHGLVIHEQRVSAVTIVGRVESVREQTTSSAFTLRDECGPGIEVNFWTVDEKKETNSVSPSIVENSLVRVYGQVRHKEGNVFISAFKVIPVKDANEIAVHNLEVLYHCKMLEKKKLNHFATNGDVPMGGFMDDASVEAPVNGSSGLSAAQNLILQRIASVVTPEGISLEELLSSVNSLDKKTIGNTIDFLLREGHVYTTIDDVHYKPTNM